MKCHSGAICCATGENLWWLVALYDTNYNICAVINILESSEVHSEDNKALPEKSKKRRFKTPSQVEALEKFYIGMCALIAISHLAVQCHTICDLT